MKIRIAILAASALVMGACGDRSEDISEQVGEETATPEYVYGDQDQGRQEMDLIEGDGSEVPNDNAVVDTRVDTGPANLDTQGSIPTPEDGLQDPNADTETVPE